MPEDIVLDPPVRLLPQWDSRWSTRTLHDDTTWKASGCHPSSVASILRWFAEDNPASKGAFKFPTAENTTIKPEHYGPRMCEGFWPELRGEIKAYSNQCAHTDLMNKAAAALGMDPKKVLINGLDALINALKYGPVAINMTHPGHFVLCHGYKDGRLLIVDPGNCLYSMWKGVPGKTNMPPESQWPGGAIPGQEGTAGGYVSVHPTESTYTDKDGNKFTFMAGVIRMEAYRWMGQANTQPASGASGGTQPAGGSSGAPAGGTSGGTKPAGGSTAPAGGSSAPAGGTSGAPAGGSSGAPAGGSGGTQPAGGSGGTQPAGGDDKKEDPTGIVEGDYSTVKIQLAGGGTGPSPARPTKGTQLVWGGDNPSSPWAHLVAQIEKGGGKVNYTFVHAATIDKAQGTIKATVSPADAASTPADAPEGQQPKAPETGYHTTTVDVPTDPPKPAGGDQNQTQQQQDQKQDQTPPGTGPIFEAGLDFKYKLGTARVWAHPKTKGNGKRPLIVYLHGNNAEGQTAPPLDKEHMGKLLKPQMDKGEITPLVIAAPTHKSVANHSVSVMLWHSSAFDLSDFVTQVVAQAKEQGVEIDLDQVIATGHSGAGGISGHGMNRIASNHGKFTVDGAEHSLKVFGIMDTGFGSCDEWKKGLASADKTDMYVIHRESGGWGSGDYKNAGYSQGIASTLGCKHRLNSITGGKEEIDDCEDGWDNQGNSPFRMSLKINVKKLSKYHDLWKATGGWQAIRGGAQNHWDMVPMWTWWAVPRYFPGTDADKQATQQKSDTKQPQQQQGGAAAGGSGNNAAGGGGNNAGAGGGGGGGGNNAAAGGGGGGGGGNAPAGGTTNNAGGTPAGGDGGGTVSGGTPNIPPPPPVWTNPAGDIDPKLYAAPFADPGTAVYWPVRGKGKMGRAISYTGTDGKGYGLDAGKGKWGTGARNFLAGRSGGERYHVGIDVWGDYNDLVVAIENGTIVNSYAFYHGVDCLIVQCDSGLVINYGEVDPDAKREFKRKAGTVVKAGQPIARVGRMTGGSSMLHFETYPTGTKQNGHYYKKDPESVLKKGFFDPTQYLLSLAKNGK
ncbi:MAG: peptidoglycan DD-metalloendopeptidase family protein [Deltaproteobacteria bacterium]|nr:peptidoglycan DD-metalloendopeptidase family protein [Deltaproteobacteria bacterium]